MRTQQNDWNWFIPIVFRCLMCMLKHYLFTCRSPFVEINKTTSTFVNFIKDCNQHSVFRSVQKIVIMHTQVLNESTLLEHVKQAFRTVLQNTLYRVCMPKMIIKLSIQKKQEYLKKTIFFVYFIYWTSFVWRWLNNSQFI